MIYDKIDWHSGNNFPKELPYENGGIHIGMFISWIINNDLVGLLHIENSKESIIRVKNRLMTGKEFLIKECDGKLWSEDLNKEGNSFSNFYYATEKGYGQYIDDYSVVFNDYETLYNVEDNWENYNKIEHIISKRFREWKANN